MNKLINISLFQKHITFGTIRVVMFLSLCVSPFSSGSSIFNDSCILLPQNEHILILHPRSFAIYKLLANTIGVMHCWGCTILYIATHYRQQQLFDRAKIQNV